MQDYELTVVLPGDTTPAKKKTILNKVIKDVSALKGKVGKADDWGRIDMAYKIDGNEAGIYVLLPLELNKSAAKELSTRLKLESSLLRYLLVKAEKKGKGNKK